MIRTVLLSAAFAAAVLAPAAAHPAAPRYAVQAAPAAQISAADAAPFLGDWTLALQGPNGPATFTLSVKVDADKVVGEIGAPTVPAQKIADISKTEKGVALSYTFPYDGMNIDAIVSLTPGTDGKPGTAQIDFAGGAYVMTGTATRKEKDK